MSDDDLSNEEKLKFIKYIEKNYQKNSRHEEFLIIGEGKKPENYRAEGWLQFKYALTIDLNN